MKLCQLDLLRYGHLSDMALSFPDNVRLHVVHGVNEAGKSTALAAVADALFGFGHRTDFDFLHGAPNLRVGFTLSACDGAVASFVRRKGRRDTLRDVNDQAVPDEFLRKYLGGASRDQFECGFGLDGARLREGGRELLRLGGEVGESLLAGAGLLNLRVALARLDDEAKSLVGDGRGRRRLSDAADVWRQAQRETEERAVPPRAWQEAEAAHATAVAELATVQGQIRALAEESSRLQRVRRVVPLLTQLGEARESLTQLADAPHLPADAESQFHVLVAAQRDADRDGERERTEVQRLTAARAALPGDAAVIALQDTIDALISQRAVVLQAVNDLPQVQSNVANLRAKVIEATRALGLSLSRRRHATRSRLPPLCVRCIGWSDSTLRWLPTSDLPDAPWLPASAVATMQRRRWRRHRSRSLLDYYVGRLMQRVLKGHWTGSCLEHSACLQKQKILSLPRSPHCRCGEVIWRLSWCARCRSRRRRRQSPRRLKLQETGLPPSAKTWAISQRKSPIWRTKYRGLLAERLCPRRMR